ncbi:pyrroline-5-carboxylate reductase isoform X1 [Colletes gigas]|uniref:pyrroline-5-carboxylate reductase isoform X1 n=2 Tax=Colletes gigas TaxID=935657 RepID=UPI001C9B964A|nr:pyrroline-5-carboxylate reductase isoform X1 [Colletes gigas]XP_043250016.1 pyrroline-5-carboxylate reductase isoform X1 [Colletes gigas]XP_043250017.1 pyrroline-5-carboxylate reductase isoform X1 [Colletes gigas]XP_043250018.1 pyrroline-5-carboxylate reductase isoform X1 [Colletes gigas]XP_043250019.1 pyrroline-5-carboxylate reductase isoform X1 [Colletes gigas]XP_043250020.1 pyrroline-5-carboxylate reductase isoform X1 [Colletes gigas]
MTTGLKTMEFLKLSRRMRRRLDARNVSDQLLAGGEKKKKKLSLDVDTNMLKIGFIGGGKMAQSLAKGFIRAGLSKGEKMLASCLPNDVGSIDTFKEIGSNTVFTNGPVVDYGDVLILSVKPQVVPQVLPDLKNYNKLLLSIAMGVPLSSLEKALPTGTPVIRVMPNTPALVGCGATVYARGKNAGDKEAEIAEKLFSSVGICEEVSENLIDPVTALAGSGPAYVYMMIEALADGGVKMGLTRPVAYKLAAQTVLGAGAMVKETNMHPAQLKDDVASPAGSTITAIHYLEEHGLRSAVIGAVEAATKRCREFSSSSESS